jgi:hypothetical protein
MNILTNVPPPTQPPPPQNAAPWLYQQQQPPQPQGQLQVMIWNIQYLVVCWHISLLLVISQQEDLIS